MIVPMIKAFLLKMQEAMLESIATLLLAAILPLLLAYYDSIFFYIESYTTTQTKVRVIIASALLNLIFLILAIVLASKYFSRKKDSVKYFESRGYKWRADVSSGGYFSVQHAPFCLIHDLQMIDFFGAYSCPNLINKDNSCKSHIPNDETQNLLHSTAESEFDKKLRS